MARWYREGTASVANGSTAVTGAACAWATQVKPGDPITFDGGAKWYEIESVTDNTHLVLADAFAEATVSGGAYRIQRLSTDHALAADLSVRVGTLLDKKAMVLYGGGPPSPSIGGPGWFYVDTENSKWHTRGESAWDSGVAFFGGPQGRGYGGTSTTSLAIGALETAHTLHLGGGYAYEVGQRIRFAKDSDNYVEGPCTAYDREGTGDITISPDKKLGSGTHATWTISVAGDWPGLPAIDSNYDGALQVLADTPVADTYRVQSRRVVDVRSGATENVNSDARGKMLVFNRATAIACALTPDTDGWSAILFNINTGNVTVTPTSGTINGAASLVLAQGQWSECTYDGTGWRAPLSNLIRQTDLNALSADKTDELDAAVDTLNSAIAAKLTSPLITEGDVLVRGSAGHVRLPIGANGYYLRVNTGIAGKLEWVNVPPGTVDFWGATTDTSPAGKYAAGVIDSGSGLRKFPIDKIGAGIALEFWPASALTAKNNSGASSGAIDAGTSDNALRTLEFSGTTAKYAQGFWKPLTSWDGGTLKFRPVYTVNPSVSTGWHTSTSSVTIGTGTKQFTLNSINQGYVVNMKVMVAGASIANWMYGTVTAYNGTTKVLEVDVTDYGGSGTYASWTVRGSVVWEVSAVFVGRFGNFNTVMGTGVSVADAVPIAPLNMITTKSAAITPSVTPTGATPSGDGLIGIQIGRLVADSFDNCPIVVSLLGLEIEYTRSRNYEV